MKIAISVGLLLGLTHYAVAFPCYWNGAGSSYVYRKSRIHASQTS